MTIHRTAKRSRDDRGQAALETVLAIPLLFLFAAGTFQFTCFFSARTALDRACREAAREFAASRTAGSGGFSAILTDHLGAEGERFELSTLRVETASTGAFSSGRPFPGMDKGAGWFPNLKERMFDYTGNSWKVSVRTRAIPLFGPLFPEGLPIVTEFAVLRFTGGSLQ